MGYFLRGRTSVVNEHDDTNRCSSPLCKHVIFNEPLCGIVFPFYGEHAEQELEGFRWKKNVQCKTVLQYPQGFAASLQACNLILSHAGVFNNVGLASYAVARPDS